MSDAIPVNRKKRGRPKVGSTLVGVRIEPDLLAGLDRFATETGNIGRPEAVRLLLRDALLNQGYLRTADEGLRPDQLTTEDDG